jgi:hypothetical protein
MDETPRGRGPLAGTEPQGGPIDDPALADRANPRWDDPTTPEPDAPPLGSDQAARPLSGRAEPGTDNILEGRGGGTPNPSLAEGGSG